jgi:hypothetical protein
MRILQPRRGCLAKPKVGRALAAWPGYGEGATPTLQGLRIWPHAQPSQGSHPAVKRRAGPARPARIAGGAG